MEERQIRKWLRRRFSAVGWTLVVYYLILNVLVVLAVASDAARHILDGAEDLLESDLMNNGWGYLATVAAGLTVLYGWKGGDYFRDTLAQKRRGMTPYTLIALTSLCVGAQLVNGLWITGLEWVLNQFDRSALDMLEQVSGYSDSFSMFLYASILGPISEEILFRGYVLRTLEPFGKKFAIFGSALLFGLFHGNLLQAPYAFLVGLVLGYVTVEYSLFWAIGVHIFNNFVLADLLTRMEESMPAGGQNTVEILMVLFGLASVGFLFRGRAVLRGYHDLTMDRRCLKCFFTNSGVVVLILLMAASMAMTLGA